MGLVVDNSAALTVLLQGRGSESLLHRLDDGGPLLMSAPRRVELGIVLEARYGPTASDVAERFVRDAEIDIVAADAETADRALSAWRRWGRAPSALDLGECFSHALAEQTGFPLLCAGDRFTGTGVYAIRPPAR